MKPWNLVCDFDGTISVEDVTDALLERFGTEGWVALEELWRRGEISSRVCMQRQIAHLDVSREELDATIDGFRIDPAFPAFAQLVRARGWTLCVVSDGLDYAIRRILARHGLQDLPVYANHLVQTGERSWRLESPCADRQCAVDAGTCKCVRARNAQAAGEYVVLVGDGASDFCVAGQADFVLAKHRLIEHCRTQGINHYPIVGFDDAIRMISALEEGFDDMHRSFHLAEETQTHE